MVEKIAPKPLLQDQLTAADKAMLGQTVLTPGYKVLVRLMESACMDSRIAINDVNPEDDGYEQILKARQQYSRAVNKFTALVLRSVEHHVAWGAAEEQQKELEVLKTIKSND